MLWGHFVSAGMHDSRRASDPPPHGGRARDPYCTLPQAATATYVGERLRRVPSETRRSRFQRSSSF